MSPTRTPPRHSAISSPIRHKLHSRHCLSRWLSPQPLWCCCCALVSLAFPFYFYGEPYTTVYVGSNGNLHFGVPSESDSYGFLPIPAYEDNSLLPVFAPFFADYDLANKSNVTWSLETLAPGQRALLIRYTDIEYREDAYYGNSDAMSMDVLLYESPRGRIDVRYYRVDVDESDSTSVQIGMQSREGLLGGNGSGDGYGYYSSYFLLFDLLPIDATPQSALLNTTLTFNFTGIEDTNSTCGGLGYDFSNISMTDLTFWNQSSGYVYFLHLCGAVTQPYCAASLAQVGYRTMICQADADGSGAPTNSTFALAAYNPNALYWQYLSNGVRATVQDGMLCSEGAKQPRVSILNFLCDPAAVNAHITGAVEQPSCTYTFTVSTNIACGNGSRSNPTGAVPSTLPSCQNITGVGYSATWCPRPFSSPAAYTPQTLTNLSVDSTLDYDDAYDTISVGFNVQLYGTNYSLLIIDTNGLLTFGPSPPESILPLPFPDLGLDSSDYYPLIAPLWVDLTNIGYDNAPSTYSGFIGYSLEGTAPNRQFFVRFSNVEYFSAEEWAVPDTCTFDVVLSENSTDIETRYYYIAPNPSAFDAFVVGMHGQNSSVYTAVQNAPLLSVDIARRLSYSTIVYSYTGQSETAVCGGGVFPQLADIPDLTYSSQSSRYWLKPCGVTSTSACLQSMLATQAASVCEVYSGVVSSLATDNPTATQWYMTSNSSVRSMTQDGASTASCGATPTVIVDYQCMSNAAAAAIDSVVVSNCTYIFVVYTSLLCAAVPPSTSSSSSSTSSSFSSSSPSSSSSSSSTLSSSSPAMASASSAIAGSRSSSLSAAASSPTASTAATSVVPVVQPTSAPTAAPSAASSSSSTAVTAAPSTNAPVVQPSSTAVNATAPSSFSSSSSTAVGAGHASESDDDDSGLSGGAIAGIVIGSVVGAVLLGLLLALVVSHSSKRGDSGSVHSKRMKDNSELRDVSDGTQNVELQSVSQ